MIMFKMYIVESKDDLEFEKLCSYGLSINRFYIYRPLELHNLDCFSKQVITENSNKLI